MTRVSDAFRALDLPLEPDRDFADALFESLAADLGFRPQAKPGPVARWLDRLSVALGLGRLDTGVSRRLTAIAIILGLLAAAMIGLILLAGSIRLNNTLALTGNEIAADSQAVYPKPPPFDMTVRFSSTDILRYRYDGGTDLRTDVISGSVDGSPEGPGSFRIETSAKEAIYDATNGSWHLADLPAPRPPLFTMFPLNWIAQEAYVPPASPPGYACPAWQRLADGVVADRPSYHIDCPAPGDTGVLAAADFWIDQASFLVVGSGSEVKATSLAIGLTPDPGIYDLRMPAGAHDEDNPPPSTVLEVGQVAPNWTGILVDGSSFSTATLRGTPAAVYFWTDWCDPCLHESLDAFAHFSRAPQFPGIGFVTVAWMPTSEAAVRAVLGTNGGVRTVLDDDGAILTDWGLPGVPSLVLLRADGTVASVSVIPLTSTRLEAMLSALRDGEPIPSAAPSGSECGCPSPSAITP